MLFIPHLDFVRAIVPGDIGCIRDVGSNDSMRLFYEIFRYFDRRRRRCLFTYECIDSLEVPDFLFRPVGFFAFRLFVDNFVDFFLLQGIALQGSRSENRSSNDFLFKASRPLG